MVDDVVRERLLRRIDFIRSDIEEFEEDFDELFFKDMEKTEAMKVWRGLGSYALSDAYRILGRVHNALYHCNDEFLKDDKDSEFAGDGDD